MGMERSVPTKSTLEFVLPRTGVSKILPRAVIPYVEITRMHILPINCVCFYPFLVGIAFAADVLGTSLDQILWDCCSAYLVAFFAGCAGHTLDDCLDCDLDRKNSRCCNRPLVSGAISRSAGFAYAFVLLATFLAAVHAVYGSPFMPYGIACAALFWIYPLSKRWWSYPQIILGVLHGLPVPWAAAALGVDPLRQCYAGHCTKEAFQQALAVCAMYLAFATCTMIFDVGYGLLDVEDDLKNGIGSMSVRFRYWTKELLWTLAIVHAASLMIAGYLCRFGWMYFVSCATAAAELTYLINHLDTSSEESAIRFFMTVNTLIEGHMVLSLMGDILCTKIFDHAI